MTVRGLLLAGAILASEPVDAAAFCHRYSIWRYPTPQRCGQVNHRFADAQHAGENGTARGEAATAPRALDIPLPNLTRSDCEGGEADELTRGRLMLRAALEQAHGD